MVSWSPLKVLLIRSWHIQGKRPLRQHACCLQHSSVVGPNKGPHSCSTQDFDKGWRKRIILYRAGLTSNTVIAQSSELHEQYQQPGERDLLMISQEWGPLPQQQQSHIWSPSSGCPWASLPNKMSHLGWLWSMRWRCCMAQESKGQFSIQMTVFNTHWQTLPKWGLWDG